MRFVNRDDFPSIAIDLMFEDIDDVGVWFCSAGREPQSSDTNGFLCTIAILVGIDVAQPKDSFFESVVAFRGVCSDELRCERISPLNGASGVRGKRGSEGGEFGGA